jgi:hypothetical protein
MIKNIYNRVSAIIFILLICVISFSLLDVYLNEGSYRFGSEVSGVVYQSKVYFIGINAVLLGFCCIGLICFLKKKLSNLLGSIFLLGVIIGWISVM